MQQITTNVGSVPVVLAVAQPTQYSPLIVTAGISRENGSGTVHPSVAGPLAFVLAMERVVNAAHGGYTTGGKVLDIANTYSKQLYARRSEATRRDHSRQRGLHVQHLPPAWFRARVYRGKPGDRQADLSGPIDALGGYQWQVIE